MDNTTNCHNMKLTLHLQPLAELKGFHPMSESMPKNHGLNAVKGAFTLIEMLVSIALIATLMALLVPTLQGARKAARTAVCAAHMRQQGVMVGQYAADTRDYIPQSVTGHGIINKNYVGGGAVMMAATGSGGTGTCLEYAANPYGTYRLMPVGAGWFYYMGYLPPVVRRGKLGILGCPDSPALQTTGTTWATFTDSSTVGQGLTGLTTQWMNQKYAGLTSNMGLANASYDCQMNLAYTDYYYRGWALKGLISPTPRYSEWAPSKAFAVDREQFNTNASSLPPASVKDGNFLDTHDDGVNIMFIDGHVTFGGKNLEDTFAGHGIVPPFVYYNLKDYPAIAYGVNWGIGGGNANSGHPGTAVSTTPNAYNHLWAYYETGIP
jgi:prepilin-type N-terminal cleavage/methylation domain-containing protein/prepilin-type processing-associated H-X9-DG protein